MHYNKCKIKFDKVLSSGTERVLDSIKPVGISFCSTKGVCMWMKLCRKLISTLTGVSQGLESLQCMYTFVVVRAFYEKTLHMGQRLWSKPRL